MSQLAESLLWELARTTLWLAAAGVLAFLVLRLARVTSPTLHRACWVVVLLVGWSLTRVPLEVPWYPAELPAAAPFEPDVADVEMYEPAFAHLPPAAPATPFSLDAPVAAPIAAPPIEPPEVPANEAPVWSLPSWPQLAILTWIVGMLALVGASLAGYLWFVLRLPRGLGAEDTWKEEWRALQSEQRVKRPIPLRVTQQLGPLLCRLPRGYELLVPEALWHELGPIERRAILRHELAHWVRSDLWKSLAVRLLALPHWFNPVSWWAVRSFDEAAEWACDRAATEGEPAAYAKVLMRVGELAAPRVRYGTALRGRALAARIRRLVTGEPKEDRTMKQFLLATALMGVVLAALVRVQLVAQEPETLSKDEKGETEKTERAAPPPSVERPLGEQFAKTPKLRAAERAMVQQAHRAYDAAMSAYDAETITYDQLAFWSSRWLAGELAFARTRKERIAAASAHVKRMQTLQQKVKALYESGTRGGEALQMAGANFYVAQAEAELARQTAVKETPPAKSQSDAGNTFEEGGVTFRVDEKGRHFAVGPKAPDAPAAETHPLRYQGRTFEEWKEDFQTELDPMKRSIALGVLGEFAAHGYGRQVAELVMAEMGGYSFWFGDLVNAGQQGVQRSAQTALKKVPPEELLPVLLETLSGNVAPPRDSLGGAPLAAEHRGNKNQRLLAISLLPYAAPQAAAVDYLLRNVVDAEFQVRWTTRLYASLLGHDSPEVVEMIRATLKHPNRDDVLNAVGIVGGSPLLKLFDLPGDASPHYELAPEIIEFLGSPDRKVRAAAIDALRQMGNDAWPLLEEAAKSKNADMAKAAREVMQGYAPGRPADAYIPRAISPAQPTYETPKAVAPGALYPLPRSVSPALPKYESAPAVPPGAPVSPYLPKYESPGAVPPVAPTDSGADAGKVPVATAATTRHKRAQTYLERTYDQWAETLRTELDPDKRAQASQALIEFAASGRGGEVAQLILENVTPDAAGPGSVATPADWLRFRAAQAQLEALSKAGSEALPVVLRFLQAGTRTQRLFAMRALPYVAADMKSVLPQLQAAGRDADGEVRRSALAYAALYARDDPRVTEALANALEHEDPQDVILAIKLVAGMPIEKIPVHPQVQPLASLASAFRPLTKHSNPEVRRQAIAALAIVDKSSGNGEALPATPPPDNPPPTDSPDAEATGPSGGPLPRVDRRR